MNAFTKPKNTIIKLKELKSIPLTDKTFYSRYEPDVEIPRDLFYKIQDILAKNEAIAVSNLDMEIETIFLRKGRLYITSKYTGEYDKAGEKLLLANSSLVLTLDVNGEHMTAELITDKTEDLPYVVKTIDTAAYLASSVTLDNVDMRAVVGLNLAAGNFLDFSKELPVELVESNLKRQVGIDINECFELLEAYVTGDMSLFRDALADKRITLNGFQTIVPFSLIQDHRSAVENNFTRFDVSYERALETQQKYARQDVPTEITCVKLKHEDGTEEQYFVNKVAEDCTVAAGVFNKGKWVKSAYFTNDEFKSPTGMIDAENPDAVKKRYDETKALIENLSTQLDQVFQKKMSQFEI